MAGLYIHIPFCASRCVYCGFYSTTLLTLQEQYVEALLQEIKMYPQFSTFDTIYLGGGTPSTLSSELLGKIFHGIFSNADCSHATEVTIECNPDDITPEFAAWLGASPVNRVSMGAQTFNDDRLAWLHRRHTSAQVEKAVDLLHANGIRNISIDLMFGFPGEALEEWNKDISCALALNPKHISAYSLMYEEGTALYRMLEKGEIDEIDDEVSLQMYDTLVSRLTNAGYEHYEISNFAMSGYRSRHNSSYWRQVPYLGIGAAAHSYDGNKRWWNVDNVKEYIRNINSGILPSDYEMIDERTRYNDIITTALRTCEGIDLSAITTEQRTYLLEQAEGHIKNGRLTLSDSHLHLTHNGIYTSDNIMSDLIMLT